MHVALVLDRLDARRGGVETWTADFARALLNRGHSVTVLAARFGREERHMGIEPVELPAMPSKLAFADVAAAAIDRGPAGAGWGGRAGFDVVHDMGVGWRCDVLHPHGGSRAAANVRNRALLSPVARPLRRLAERTLPRYRDFSALAAAQFSRWEGTAKRTIALSHGVADDLATLERADPAALAVVPNGVDTKRFTPESRGRHRERTRRELSVGDGEALALIVAHNLKLKGLPTLLKAVARLRGAGAPIKLAVAGGKPKTWRRSVDRLGLGDAVRLLGPVDDPRPLYAAADVYAQPTHHDPCSLVALEALACGLPVVTTTRNGVGELMTGGTAGGVCPSGEVLDDPADDAALAAALGRLCGEDARAEAGVAARSLAERHPFARNVADLLAVYDAVRENPSGLRVAA